MEARRQPGVQGRPKLHSSDQAGLQSKALSQNIGGWGVRIKKRSKGAWQVREERKKREKQVGMIGQTYNPSTWEAKVGGLLSSRSAITT